jgi:hypothetical protein
MARRRFQAPRPYREGDWWWVKVWKDFYGAGGLKRKQVRLKVCPATTPDRQARQIAAELLQPMNSGLETVENATPFSVFINSGTGLR